jgi:hypothetical protein
VEQSEGRGVSSKSSRLNIDGSEPRLIALFTWPNGTQRIIDPRGIECLGPSTNGSSSHGVNIPGGGKNRSRRL